MPIDFSGLTESLQRGLGGLPAAAIVLALLAGPTAVLIGYRLIRVARRASGSGQVEAAPLWVCQACRSVNELRLSRCYRCGVGRDATDEIEVILDRPSGRPATFQVPAGSPFAAIATGANATSAGGAGVPVMVDPSLARDRIAVGPGGPTDAEAEPTAVAAGNAASRTSSKPSSGSAAPRRRRRAGG
jgi:hypothetical protein